MHQRSQQGWPLSQVFRYFSSSPRIRTLKKRLSRLSKLHSICSSESEPLNLIRFVMSGDNLQLWLGGWLESSSPALDRQTRPQEGWLHTPAAVLAGCSPRTRHGSQASSSVWAGRESGWEMQKKRGRKHLWKYFWWLRVKALSLITRNIKTRKATDCSEITDIFD